MRKATLSIIALIALCHSASAAFPTNTTSQTIDIARLRSDFGDFSWTWRGFEDQRIEFTINSDDSGQDFTGYLGSFRISANEAGAGQTDQKTWATDDVTISGSNVVFSLSYTNIPAAGVYKGELILIDSSSTNVVRSIARGTIKVQRSLYGN